MPLEPRGGDSPFELSSATPQIVAQTKTRVRSAEIAASKNKLSQNFAHLRDLRNSGELGDQLVQAAQALILCGLPYRPTNSRQIVRRARLGDGSTVSATFSAALANVPLPYGADRTLLHWLVDKAIKSKSPIVPWRTASRFLKDAGLSESGKNRKDLKERYLRLSGLTIGIIRRGAMDSGMILPLIEKFNLPGSISTGTGDSKTSLTKDGQPLLGFKLGEMFFKEILKYHVPVPFELLSALKHRSQMQDIALFLYWRSFAAQQDTLIPWEGLREQLWQDDSNLRRMRERFRDTIRVLKIVWPELNAEAASSGLQIGQPTKHLLPQAQAARRLS